MSRYVLTVVVLCICCHAKPTVAQQTTHHPSIYRISPVAAQIGKTSLHEIEVHFPDRLTGAFAVVISGDGVKGEIVATPVVKGRRPRKPQIQITVADDAETGVRDIRVVTPQGASTLGQLVIVRDPVFWELDKNRTRNRTNNDSLDTAQQVAIPQTICGAIDTPQDVDFFKFTATAGSDLVLNVRSKRLQDRIHLMRRRYQANLIATLRDQAGKTIAVSDNYFSADPCLGYHFTRTGQYYLEIRDIHYESDTSWAYCVEVHNRALVSRVFPLGVNPQQPTQLELFGFNLADSKQATINLPARPHTRSPSLGPADDQPGADGGHRPAADDGRCSG